jgi:hypothetical protein
VTLSGEWDAKIFLREVSIGVETVRVGGESATEAGPHE